MKEIITLLIQRKIDTEVTCEKSLISMLFSYNDFIAFHTIRVKMCEQLEKDK